MLRSSPCVGLERECCHLDFGGCSICPQWSYVYQREWYFIEHHGGICIHRYAWQVQGFEGCTAGIRLKAAVECGVLEFSHCSICPERACQLCPQAGSKHSRLLREMQCKVVGKLNRVAAAGLLRSSKGLSDGRRVHAELVRSGYGGDPYLGNLLISMYGGCGSVEDAVAVFLSLKEANRFSWIAMVGAYAQNGYPLDALHCLRKMDWEGLKPMECTYASIISSCSSLSNLKEGKKMHARVMNAGLEWDVVIGTALINLYGRCGSLEDAVAIFEKMQQRDVVAWNAMVAAYAQNGHYDEAVALYHEMDSEQGVVPNRASLISVLDACSGLGSLAEGRSTHQRFVSRGIELDVVARNALIGMYGKCGSVDDAKDVFEGIQEKDVVSWTAMISAYAQQGHLRNALKFYRGMVLEGIKPNRITFFGALAACSSQAEGDEVHRQIVESGLERDGALCNCLITMYGKCRSLDDARSLFERMPARNVVSWSATIAAHVQSGDNGGALDLFFKMDPEGVAANKTTFINILGACNGVEYLAEGKAIHARIAVFGLEAHAVVSNALVTMYGKCGSIDGAKWVFERMREKSMVSWTSMIAAYAQNGHPKEALGLYWKMDEEGVPADEVTYISALDACGSSSSLENGERIHARIHGSGSEPSDDLNTALLNMYGKCGRLGDAERLFKGLRARSSIVSWNTMIAIYAHNQLGKEALVLLQQMDLEGVSPIAITFIGLLDACSSMREGRNIHARIVASGIGTDAVVLATAIVHMYGQCGNLDYARQLFESMEWRTVVSWNAMLAAYARHGHIVKALALFRRMHVEGISLNESSFLVILFACSHAGLLDEAQLCIASMIGDHGLEATEEHYGCIIDLLGRMGRLEDARDLISSLPFQSGVVEWITLLGACRTHSSLVEGVEAAQNLSKLNPNHTASYVMLSNIYAAATSCKSETSAKQLTS